MFRIEPQRDLIACALEAFSLKVAVGGVHHESWWKAPPMHSLAILRPEGNRPARAPPAGALGTLAPRLPRPTHNMLWSPPGPHTRAPLFRSHLRNRLGRLLWERPI